MKNIFTVIVLLFSSFLLHANELVIEVTTDKYPNETSWKLFDNDRNVIHENGVLEKQTTYRDTFQLDASLCYYWTIYDTYGNGISDGTPPGGYKIYFDGVLMAEIADPNFGDSASVYGIGSSCAAYDVSIEELTFDGLQAFNPFDFSFSVLNFGSEQVNTLEVAYSIDGTEYTPVVLDGLTVEHGQKAGLVLPDKIQITTAGDYELVLKVLKINGEPDGYTNNSVLTKTITVNQGYWQKPIHEVFTSSTCGPCKYGNETIDGTLSTFDAEQYSLVKYQVNWPGDGDPYYTKDVGSMMGLYGINAVPSLYVNLTKIIPGAYNPDVFESFLGDLTGFGVTLSANLIGDSVFVQPTITSAVNAAADVFMRLMVVEKTTYNNVMTNGETEFHNVFMKFITNWSGDNLGKLSDGDVVELDYAASLEKTNVEELNDLRIVMYLFYKNSYTILQSEMIDLPYSAAPPHINSNIANDSVGVDTVSVIEFASDKELFNADGSVITDITKNIAFVLNDGTNRSVEFTAELSGSYNRITIKPNNPLKPNTGYTVKLSGLYSGEGVMAEVVAINFVTAQKVVGLRANSDAFFMVYPNPASCNLNISAICNGSISIVDVAGNAVCSQNIHVGQQSMDISYLKPGIYFIYDTLDGNRKMIKLIKK